MVQGVREVKPSLLLLSSYFCALNRLIDKSVRVSPGFAKPKTVY